MTQCSQCSGFLRSKDDLKRHLDMKHAERRIVTPIEIRNFLEEMGNAYGDLYREFLIAPRSLNLEEFRAGIFGRVEEIYVVAQNLLSKAKIRTEIF